MTADVRMTVDRRVSCLLPNGAVAGDLRVRDAVRVSDYLMQHEGFIVLRQCYFAGQEPGAPAEPIVLVDSGGLIGVTETD